MLRILILAATFALAASPALAVIDSVTWSPENPVEGETLVVEVAGGMPDGCWVIDSTSFEQADHVLLVSVFAVDTWVPDVPCTDMVVPYEVTATFPTLEAGTYLLQVTEHHDSPRDPDNVVENYDIVVESSVATASATWTALRAHYR